MAASRQQTSHDIDSGHVLAGVNALNQLSDLRVEFHVLAKSRARREISAPLTEAKWLHLSVEVSVFLKAIREHGNDCLCFNTCVSMSENDLNLERGRVREMQSVSLQRWQQYQEELAIPNANVLLG